MCYALVYEPGETLYTLDGRMGLSIPPLKKTMFVLAIAGSRLKKIIIGISIYRPKRCLFTNVLIDYPKLEVGFISSMHGIHE